MKALIRNEGETVKESDGIVGIDWNTGLPMTSPEWCGGPYQLVENYIEYDNGEVTFEDPVVPLEVVEEQNVSGSEEVEDVVLYNFDGKMYTLEELKEKLNKI